MANETKKPALYLAEYGTPNAIARAAMRVRDAGYQKWDCHTPYAMHGMDEAMGLKPTRIGYISFIFGMIGLATAVFMMNYTNAFSFNLLNIGAGYPLVVGGKPPGAFPSMVPIIFELGILLCGLSTFFGLLAIIKLPRHNHPIFESERFEAASDDRFFISIEVGDQKFNLDGTKALLEATDPISLELIEEEVR
ncbi:MAG: DUF3341 domain-containing protein [Deltaproteobacteria bacterium]|jgi:hypothetical protein|nr:DUF3341 domain-containing protein [Deltaproteobacteria bacterium]MBW1874907.1 DUF3341 domain-containing protein [Deltaproteobacteria bacterium]MBW2209534.1 DUF3341 domain-containing protein [Deltaproteobacteria bacterium]MBW2378076.1 DUF3341 domain-containing protein [Deltaproteobacteria bacterium]MBW2549662.1 DUF3341 domain-containing protein [Deltaproteobacteria bacterium]